MEQINESGFRAGYIALIGAPNVGKSTLLNQFTGEKLAIVTPKPQTTRHRIFGIATTDTYQAIFQDTPGYLEPEYLLHEKMMGFARKSLDDADVILLLIDGAAPELPVFPEKLLNDLADFARKPLLLILNKTDKSTREKLDRLTQQAKELFPGAESLWKISAKNGDNCPALMKHLVPFLPEHPPFYPVEDLSTHHIRFFVEEIIREKIFFHYGKEIPYSSTVQVTDYKEREDGIDQIEADIIVERPSQKIIVVGKSGNRIRDLGIASRTDIEALVGKQVFLRLFVKVRENWRKSGVFVKSYGYEP